MRLFVNTLLALLLAITAGCVALPLYNEGIEDPALRQIADRYEQVIRDAHNDPDTSWQSGWFGNMWVHYSDDPQRGLCYEWKWLVHDGIVDTVHDVGWQLRGIAVREGKSREHHAVVVFNPQQLAAGELLEGKPGQAYVLDAWQQGEADIYELQDWLGIYATDSTPRIHVVLDKQSRVQR
jgi:hypothetical protein